MTVTCLAFAQRFGRARALDKLVLQRVSATLQVLDSLEIIVAHRLDFGPPRMDTTAWRNTSSFHGFSTNRIKLTSLIAAMIASRSAKPEMIMRGTAGCSSMMRVRNSTPFIEGMR